jgi:hypothetical protein
MDMKGILQKMGYAPLGHAPTIEEMDEAIFEYVAELDRATKSDSLETNSDHKVA